MFDVFFALLLGRSILVTARGRSGAGLLASVLAFLIWGLLAMAGWYGRRADALGPTGAWLLVVFGPSAVPGVTARVPFSALLASHAIGARVVLTAVLGAGFAIAWRHAERISPLSDEAVRRKDLALAVLAPALLAVVQNATTALAEAMSSPFE